MVFEVGRGFEDRMIDEVFLLTILWEEKIKALLGPKIFFNDLGNPNLGGGSSFGWFTNSEEEQWRGRRSISTFESCLTFEACWE